MFETLESAVADLKSSFESSLVRHEEYKSEHNFFVKKDQVFSFCKALKEKYGFNLLIDMVGTDRFTDDERFEVIYHLRNINKAWFIRVITWIDESDPVVDSVTGIWGAANWHEREVFDMIGVQFKNHPDMRRIYMPQDYQYFPMRKDYPLIGIEGSIPLPSKEGISEND